MHKPSDVINPTDRVFVAVSSSEEMAMLLDRLDEACDMYPEVSTYGVLWMLDVPMYDGNGSFIL